MIIHCSSRIGILSYAYQHRDQVAQAIGWIEEIPIAVCSSEYDMRTSLTTHDLSHADRMPHTLVLASEINLFINTSINIKTPFATHFAQPWYTVDSDKDLALFVDSIFHPPSFA